MRSPKIYKIYNSRKNKANKASSSSSTKGSPESIPLGTKSHIRPKDDTKYKHPSRASKLHNNLQDYYDNIVIKKEIQKEWVKKHGKPILNEVKKNG